MDPRLPSLGQTVGPFELVDFLGRGGMGQVYKARDTRLDRIIALKLLLPGPEVSEQRFQREARAQAKIDHEGVCRIYEVGAAAGRTFIAMQYLKGRTLAEMAGDLTLEEKVSVIHQVAEAVQVAHHQALVHRDLKPSNIMIQRIDGALKAWVLDFGIAHVAGDVELTLTGEIVGSPSYMAPEQLLDDVTAVDRRTDVYALGSILYELLTGRPPFTGKHVLEVLSRIHVEDPIPPRQLRPNVPEDLEWITLRCLEKEPGQRYRSAAALIRDLERFRSGAPVRARESTWRYRLSKRVRKHRQFLVVVGLLLVLLAGVVWRDLNQRRDAAQAARVTERFLHQVEQIESRTRLMAARPLHDTRPEKETMLAELEALEREVETLGEIAKGPGLFALGRGYHVLGELDRGLDYLEQAWDAGNRNPMLSFDLGLAYGEKYDEHLLNSRLAADPDVRRRGKQEAELRYGAPAVEHFQRAQLAGAGDPTWAKALLATYEGRWNTALEALDEAEAASPWRTETHTLRSKVWRNQARQSSREGALEESLDQIGRAAEALTLALVIGESDSHIYAALCDVHDIRLSIAHDERVATADGRQALLEPCLQAIHADSGSVRALTSAALMAEAVAVNLLWVGDSEAKAYFEQSMEWAQQAVNINPEAFQAVNMLSKTYANLGALSESTAERNQFFAKALEQARRAVEIAPTDLEAVLSLADITLGVADYSSQVGEDVEPLLEKAGAALEPFLLHPSPIDAILFCHASLQIRRAGWYLTRGGDAEDAIAQAKVSLAAVDPAQPRDGYSTWITNSLCSVESQLSAAKGETPLGLALCREEAAKEVAAAPDDLEWAMAEANLSMLAIQLDPTELKTLQPRLESLLQRLGESELYSSPLTYDRYLGHWRWLLAREAVGEERVTLLEESIGAFARSAEITEDLEDQLTKIDAQLYLAETERRRNRPAVARNLLAESREDLAKVRERDANRIQLRLLEAVAARIETELNNRSGPSAADLAAMMSAEVDSHIGWDALLAEPYLRSKVRWWRAFLES